MRCSLAGTLGVLLLLNGCTSQAQVESAPDPNPSVIAGGGGAEPARKNPNAPENASTAARFGIPPGHLPPPGMCRVWIPGEPPGKQKRYASGECARLAAQVPPGGWLVYRPSSDRKEVEVREYGSVGRIVSVRVFDLVTGALLREANPEGR